MNKTDKIYVAGHRGMVGSAVCRCLARHGFDNVVTRTHAELDLMNPAAVKAFYESERPDVAVIAAAKDRLFSASNTLFYPACADSTFFSKKNAFNRLQ